MVLATAQDGGYGESPLVNHPETDMLRVRCGDDRRVLVHESQREVDGASRAHMVRSRDPVLRTMPAFLVRVSDGDKEVVRAKFDLQSSGECWLGWTDCWGKADGDELQHEAGRRAMPIRARFDKRGRLDCCSTDVTAPNHSSVLTYTSAHGLLYPRVFREGPGWDEINLVRMGDDSPTWITGTAAGRKRWPANAIIQYTDQPPKSIDDPRGHAMLSWKSAGGWIFSCSTCGGRKGLRFSSKSGKSRARRRQLSEWRICNCGSKDPANSYGQEVLLKYS